MSYHLLKAEIDSIRADMETLKAKVASRDRRIEGFLAQKTFLELSVIERALPRVPKFPKSLKLLGHTDAREAT